ncbi:MAG: hypothetical protein ACLQVF_24900 [Isosphaeraceae bacterium]
MVRSAAALGRRFRRERDGGTGGWRAIRDGSLAGARGRCVGS